MSLNQVESWLSESGQALVELVLLSPLLLLLVAGVFQLALICEANLLTHMAVRQAAEIYLQGGGHQVIQQEISEYFQQYPFMEGQSVEVSLVQSPLMVTLRVKCEPPVLPFIALFSQQPVLTASMSLGKEIFYAGRLPSLTDLGAFGEYLQKGM